jgi:hypothetical protein
MNNNIPHDLMNNVEKKLRTHIKDRRKKRHIRNVVAAGIALLIILPASTFAYAQYNDSIIFKQEIDLARENKNITEVNKTFKYKNVKFTIKEIVGDGTGFEVIYDVSDPKYSINEINFVDKDGKDFKGYAYTVPDLNSNKNEKAFYISIDGNNIANYMHNNPVTIKINSLVSSEDKKSYNIIDKMGSIIKNNNSLTVDWTLKMEVPMQQAKVIPVNKEYSLDIGTLKINSFKVGILKSTLDYSFKPKDNNNIKSIYPLFSVRADNEYMKDHGGFAYGGLDIYGTEEFDSIYYKKTDQIGIKLIGVRANYDFSYANVYEVDKNKLPMEFDCNGEKFKITSMEEKDDSTEYTVEYGKESRIYSEFEFTGSGVTERKNDNSNSENIQFKDQASRDVIYSSLIKKVPNLKDIEKKFGNLQKGAVSTNVTMKPGKAELRINNAVKNLIYDEDEVIVHK